MSAHDRAELVGVKQAAKILGITQGTLYNWRSWGIGPVSAGTEPSKRGGRPRVVYDVAELHRWMAANTCDHCGQRLPMRLR